MSKLKMLLITKRKRQALPKKAFERRRPCLKARSSPPHEITYKILPQFLHEINIYHRNMHFLTLKVFYLRGITLRNV